MQRSIYALSTPKHSQEHEVVVESRILEVIVYEHDLTGRVDMDYGTVIMHGGITHAQ